VRSQHKSTDSASDWDSLSFNLRKSTTSSGVDLITNHYPPPPLPLRAQSASPHRSADPADEAPPPLIPRGAASSARGRSEFNARRQTSAGERFPVRESGLDCSGSRCVDSVPPILIPRSRGSLSQLHSRDSSLGRLPSSDHPRGEAAVVATNRVTLSQRPRELARGFNGNCRDTFDIDGPVSGLRKIRYERGSSDPAEYGGRLKHSIQSNLALHAGFSTVCTLTNVHELMGDSDEAEDRQLMLGSVEVQNNLDNLSIDAARRQRQESNRTGVLRTIQSDNRSRENNGFRTGGVLSATAHSTPRRSGTPQNFEGTHIEIPSDVGRAGESAGLRRIVPLDRWPLQGSPQLQPETHFSLDRIVSKRHPAGNDYVDDPSTVAASKTMNVEDVEPCWITGRARDANARRDSRGTVTEQPKMKDFTKNSHEPSSGVPGKPGDAGEVEDDRQCGTRFVCPRCGRCRCAYCTGSSPASTALPSCWIANGRYECGAKSCIDCLSCVCCLRTIFYHCLYDEDDDVDIVAQPFADGDGPHCCARWTIIGTMVPVLPCLLLYAPLQWAVEGIGRCRGSCLSRCRRGCRCDSNSNGVYPGRNHDAPSSSSATATASSSSGTTRSLLLDSAENSSA